MLQTNQFINHGIGLNHQSREFFWSGHSDWFRCGFVRLSFDRLCNLNISLLSGIKKSWLKPTFSYLFNSVSLADGWFIGNADWNLRWYLGLRTCWHPHTLPIDGGFVRYGVSLFRSLAFRWLLLGLFLIGTLSSRSTPSYTCVSTSSESDADRRYFSVDAIFGQNFSSVDKKDCVVSDWSLVCS